MYSPATFRIDDLAELHGFIEESPLAVVVTAGEQGLLASHLPLLLEQHRGNRGTLHGHFARANPQWRELANGAEVLVVFTGPSAYVSPGYYPSKARDPKVVPTWNYTAVHVRGRAEVFDDPARLIELVRAQSEHHERNQPKPWSLDDAPADYLSGMLRAVVGFSLPIERIEGKWTLSQNQTAENRSGVRDALASNPAVSDHEVARLMNTLS
ncbi:MAG: transcriptional regulator [Pseudomonas sp.]|nr:transcriptional regulator [Pseudomonas sp.]HBS78898.1 transcriptional regulator [Pseudomonas sp.]|tara:strand:- start:17809 stop:18441 length:633 start_codon:yes stop_codon:yes gene_type:complete